MPPITTDSPEEAIVEWFTLLDEYCEAEDYDAMRPHVADDVVSFGTKAEIVTGRDHLIEEQWREIWGNIEDFSIHLGDLRAFGEGTTAWGVATWDSTGFDENGDPFYRPGRATVTLERRDGVWLARHTHFSLYPGTPPFTYGPDGADPES
ncbi:MAG: nuclear transport factor 2 family protein [Halobacteriales archaeon]